MQQNSLRLKIKNRKMNRKNSNGGCAKRYCEIIENYYHSQSDRFYKFLQMGWFTATQCEHALKMRISNITAYKRELEKKGLLLTGDEVSCPVTDKRACLITTNQDLIKKYHDSKKSRQSNLFE